MRITFVLPSYARAPIGGYKIVYEYANRLCRAGHEVAVVHPRRWSPGENLLARIDIAAWKARNALLDGGRVQWFSVDPRVRLLFVPDLSTQHFPDADVLVATAWQTAEAVAGAPSRKGGRKFYLIQGYETWSGDAEAVDATWKLPLHKIVISRWLYEVAERLGEASRATHIPNGVDLELFRSSVPLELRFPYRVGMLYHRDRFKGSAEGVRALEHAREKHADLQSVCFGAGARPPDLPGWIEYVERPGPARLVELYNSCTVFLQPSWSEGWGLTATEAMACGCALVTTDNGGSRDYAQHGQTAWVVPPRDAEALGRALVLVLGDGQLRARLARNGLRSIRKYGWENSARAMEALFAAGFPEVVG